MDLCEAGSGSRSEYTICGEEEETKRSCADCGTTKTPLWRGGPDGPKSLCNACGIRSRKRRRALLGLTDGVGTEEVKKIGRSTSSGVSIKRRILGMGMGREMQLKLQRSTAAEAEKQRRKKKMKMGEEEQAAILLMALSYGSLCTLAD